MDRFDFYMPSRDVVKSIGMQGDADVELSLRIAIDDYMLNGIEPEFAPGAARDTWDLIRPRLELSRKRRIAGRRGGQKKS